MQKNTNLCVNLKTMLQNDALLAKGQTYHGCLTYDGEDHYLFEEEVHSSGISHKRNPKLFDGRYVSLVHMQNGKYQIHMRTIDAECCPDRHELAFRVYRELLNALNIID